MKLPEWVLLIVRSAATDSARHAENSDVLLPGSVAVEVMTDWPLGTSNANGPNLALPAPLVVTLATPIYDWPSSKPLVSHASLAKNSRWNAVLAVLLSVPEIVT